MSYPFWGVPQIIQGMDDHPRHGWPWLRVETHGDLGMPFDLRNPHWTGRNQDLARFGQDEDQGFWNAAQLSRLKQDPSILRFQRQLRDPFSCHLDPARQKCQGQQWTCIKYHQISSNIIKWIQIGQLVQLWALWWGELCRTSDWSLFAQPRFS